LEGDDLLVARSVRSSRAAAAARMEMVNTSILGRSTQGAAASAIEAGAPGLRFVKAIQIRQQHNIVMPGSANHRQGAARTDADSLVWTIQFLQYDNCQTDDCRGSHDNNLHQMIFLAWHLLR